jgi:cytochrome c553
MRNKALWASLLGIVVLGGEAFGGGDPQAGKAKFYTCQGCHSIPGYTNVYPTYHVPKIGGQYEAYVIAALQAYKEGARTHGSMVGNAGSMSEQDMADLAAYLAKLESKSQEGPVTGDPAKGKALAEKCAACHGADGNATAPNFPRLAGQYESYLIKAIQDYQTGKRQNPLMQSMVQGLSAEDVHNLAAYYASQVGLGVVKGD